MIFVTKEVMIMKTNSAFLIREKIKEAKDGTIFINSDFADITNYENIRKNLSSIMGQLSRPL